MSVVLSAILDNGGKITDFVTHRVDRSESRNGARYLGHYFPAKEDGLDKALLDFNSRVVELKNRAAMIKQEVYGGDEDGDC